MDYDFLRHFNCLTIVIVVVLLVLLVSRLLQWPDDIPPGPPGYPIVGNIPLLRKGNVLKTYEHLRNQYGDVFSLKLGQNLSIVINGEDALKEAFVTNGDVFSDRAETFMVKDLLFRKGIVASSGEHWKRTRTFALTVLRNFGFGKKSLESRIIEEVEALLRLIGSQNGKPYNIRDASQVSTANVICILTFGTRFEYTDVKLQRLIELFNEGFRLNSASNLINLMQWLRFIPGDLFHFKKLKRNMKEIREFIFEQIEEHKKTYDDNNLRDYVDAFLQEQRKHNKDDPLYEDINLVISVMNLFAGGAETTATVIRWAIVYLLHHKDIQDRVRQEIEKVVGTSRFPSLIDKPKLPYFNAFVTEVLRIGDIVPLSVPHGAKQDIHFRGWTIPKGAMIVPNLHSVQWDSMLFHDPQKFNPERFLDKDGQLSSKERSIMSFSLGRRVCLGESVARMELFLYLTSLIQRFELLPEDPDNLPTLEPVIGLTRTPKDFKFRAIKLN